MAGQVWDGGAICCELPAAGGEARAWERLPNSVAARTALKGFPPWTVVKAEVDWDFRQAWKPPAAEGEMHNQRDTQAYACFMALANSVSGSVFKTSDFVNHARRACNTPYRIFSMCDV